MTSQNPTDPPPIDSPTDPPPADQGRNASLILIGIGAWIVLGAVRRQH